jgi:aspartyl-tRNA synthetase
VLDFLGNLKRTHMCGELRLSDAGKKVVLMGWVNRRRDLGQIIFVDLRDRTGITQVVFNHELNASVHQKAEVLRNEFVIAAIGTVKRRDADTINPNIPTGEVELVVEELRILNVSKPLPFLPSDTVLANEEMRLKYRYIDLRRDAMQFNIELRHKVALAIRENLASQGFFEIETPFMTRSTPEGARDYLVPSLRCRTLVSNPPSACTASSPPTCRRIAARSSPIPSPVSADVEILSSRRGRCPHLPSPNSLPIKSALFATTITGRPPT